jgi:hypothetical protein
MEDVLTFNFYVEKQDGTLQFVSQVHRNEDKMWETMRRAILSAYGAAQLLYTWSPKKIICNKIKEGKETLFISFTEDEIESELLS